MSEKSQFPTISRFSTHDLPSGPSFDQRAPLIIGAGTIACQLLQKLTSNKPVVRLYLPDYPCTKDAYSIAEKNCLLKAGTAATMQMLIAPGDVYFHPSVEGHFLPGRPVWVFALLGGHAGSAGLLALANALCQRGLSLSLFCTTPASFEDPDRVRIATTALMCLPQLPLKLFDLQEIENAQPQISKARCFRIADKILLRILKQEIAG